MRIFKKKKKCVWVIESGHYNNEGGVLSVYKRKQDAIDSIKRMMGNEKSEFVKHDKVDVWERKRDKKYYYALRWDVG